MQKLKFHLPFSCTGVTMLIAYNLGVIYMQYFYKGV